MVGSEPGTIIMLAKGPLILLPGGTSRHTDGETKFNGWWRYHVRYITVKLPKALLLLTVAEVEQLLDNDPELWDKALKRGRGQQRREQLRDRERRQGRYAAD